MTDMLGETITYTGPVAYWDPQDQGKFRALAGTQFLGVDDGNAIVLTEDEHQQVIYPGWLVMLPEGGGALFSSPSRVRVVS
jgi:hypothetical protein